MIKFNLYNITDTETKEKVKVNYDLDNHIDGIKRVTIRAKDYGDVLSRFFEGVANDTDSMTDYFCKDSVQFFEGDAHYAAARATAERLKAKRGW